mmetsp:Transcript_21289/g.68944  ORF Transcript_21289/g.68944 Transcript_21289/m.68944 type:complete len:957 (-) Transcript_21289:68-2938(-)
MDYATSEHGQMYDGRQGFEAAAGEDHRDSSSRHSGRARGGGGGGVHLGGGNGAQRSSRKGLLGLSNLGNTCFMSSALQCLTHTHGLQKYFRLCSHEYTSKGPSSRQKLLMSFAHWFERDWGKHVSAHYHSPEDILRCVQQLNPIFQGYAQQDSQEFLRCVLDNLHEELRREVPDDLRAHLLEVCGLEAGLGNSLEAQRGSSSSSDVGAARAMGSGAVVEGSSPTSRCATPSSAATATSVTRQFMQLCQTTEAATDVGEIRLTTGRQSTPMGASAGPFADGASPVFSPAWAEESHSAASSFSGAPSFSPNGCASAGTPSCSPSAPCGGGSGGAASSASSARAGGGFAGGSVPSRSASGGGGAGNEEQSESGTGRGEPATHYASIISELFQGHVVSIVRCLECQRTSRTKEPIYDVSVQIPSSNELAGGPGPELQRESSGRGPSWTGILGNVTGKVKSLFYDKGVEVTDCLRKFCAPEYLIGKDKYECEHCKRKTDGERRLAFMNLPEVLCIHIKRFRYDANWFNATKSSRVVTFPVNKLLDMASFLEEPALHPVEYRLIGLIQHIGSMGGGHYISYCQHKKKPQEWYEFDDLQVSLVSPEQVERAEPYVLFYQRVPSKANRLDRQTFKNDCRCTEAQIRQHLLSIQPSPCAASQAGIQEVRYHGPALLSFYRNPPADLDIAFVSKRWYVRLTTMSHPGPIDNYEYLCPHRLLGCSSAEMAAEPFMPISHALFQSLVQKYGGGPVVRALDICPKCQMYLRAYNDRKQAEYDLVSKYDTKDTGDGEGWYLVDAVWVNKWKRYVRSEHVSDIQDMCAPGPVSNQRLCDKTGAIRSNLKLRIDYIGVNARVWWLFMHVHGGGPAICRTSLDLYSEGHPLETELKLEELQFAGATEEFARRTSHVCVEECKGDAELFHQRYGGGGHGDIEMMSAVEAAVERSRAPSHDAMQEVVEDSEAEVT